MIHESTVNVRRQQNSQSQPQQPQHLSFEIDGSKVTLPLNDGEDQMIMLQQILDIIREANKQKKTQKQQININIQDSAVAVFCVVFGGLWIISFLVQALMSSPNYSQSARNNISRNDPQISGYQSAQSYNATQKLRRN